MQKITFAALLGLTALFGSGCVKRELVGFADHDKMALTAIRAGVTKNYFFYAEYEHVFYSCSEQGDVLDCKRVCGGETDLECPKAVASGNGVSTNIR
jgi:hypothetical protein